jgi:ferrochelatase
VTDLLSPSGRATIPEPGPPNNHLLLMAYGGPDSLDDVRPYLMDVRNYRPTSDHIVDEITERYRQIGGRSPIRELTNAEAAGIERELNALAGDDERWKVWVAMRHWHPFIKDVLTEMEEAGVARTIGLVMAPHYSRMSIGAYYKRVEAAGSPIEVAPIRSWNLLPGYLDALTDRIETALEKFPEDIRSQVPVIFTAHSLPERIREWNDPYERELQETVSALRERFPDQPSAWAYQSAAMTPDPWLGPDASEVISRLHEEGVRNVLICPVGFVCEHVEILFDIDVEFRQHANALGVRLERIEMLNDHPAMLSGLAGLVRTFAQDAGLLSTRPAGVSAAR